MIVWLLTVLTSLGAPMTLAPSIAIAAEEAPLREGPRFTAAVLVALAHLEGGLDGVDRRTDRGQTCGAWQLSLGKARCDALAGDHLAQAREARERVRLSLATCWALPQSERLAHYASGSCSRGRALARGRWGLAKYLERRP